jgi:hypothetical protein
MRRGSLGFSPPVAALWPRQSDDTADAAERLVDRSTTRTDPVDEVETGWTAPQGSGLARTSPIEYLTLPSEGRGFESRFLFRFLFRLPLSTNLAGARSRHFRAWASNAGSTLGRASKSGAGKRRVAHSEDPAGSAHARTVIPR